MKKVFLFILLVVSSVFAADEIKFGYDSGDTIYAIIRRPADGYVWNTDVAPDDWRAWNDANIADYDIALADNSGDDYSGDFPTGVTDAGRYMINVYLQAGGSPAITDSLVGADILFWDGTAEIDIYTISQDVNLTNFLTQENVEESVADQLEVYDSPTKTEMDTGFATAKTQRDANDAVIIAALGEIVIDPDIIIGINELISDVNRTEGKVDDVLVDTNDLKTTRGVPVIN